MNIFLRWARPYGRILKAINGFLYDLIRFIKYSAWDADMSNKNKRNYHIAKTYHSLEKSLSFKNRAATSGWSIAYLTLDILKEAKLHGNFGYFDRAGLKALKSFISSKNSMDLEKSADINKKIKSFDFLDEARHGSMKYSKSDFEQGVLDKPESFFLSRYSLREFSNTQVDNDKIRRAITLAEKTPSVCNRQAWHVYHSNERDVIDGVLKHQQGNRGFGDRVPNLMVITSDLNAFMPGQEHYQHWIDGGLFSMSLIYALHSLGVASCCLNWSQAPVNDKKLREEFNVKPQHTIIMMLAIGYPDADNKVCVSSRKPVDEIYSRLKKLKINYAYLDYNNT